MTEFFVSVVNMSISAGWIVLAVLLLRLLLKKAPKWITVLLWGIVAVRLVCPFTIESALSLIPSAQTINPEVALNSPAIDSGVPIVDNIVNPVIGGATISFQPEKELNFFKFIMPYFAGLWLVGIAALLIYTVVSYAKLKKKIGTAVLLRDNIFQSESVDSPFVLGIIKPKIYLPFNMNEQDMEHVIAHEQAHIHRKDHWWKPFGFLLLTIHWFNPLMWLGYVLLCRDIELACDEKVIKELNTEQKADYSQALLTCSVNRRMIAACPLAFGEVGVKNRVKSVLNYKKPAFWIIVVAIVASIIAAVCFLTNPVNNTKIDDQLKVFLDMKIAEHMKTEHTNDNFVAVDYEILHVDSWLNDTTIYAWVLYEEYSYDGNLKLEAGAHLPTVISVTKNDGTYTDMSYWTPRDGSLYAEDIKSRFPRKLWSKALDSQRYINKQKANCENAAREYFKISSNINSAEKLTWTYRPMLSFTGHYFSALSFDFEHTHVEATCTEGEFCSLEVEGQPRGTTMRFEKGKNIYWTPSEAVIEKLPKKSEVTLTIFNNKTQLYKCTVIFECVSRDLGSAEFEIYLKDSDGLEMMNYDGRIMFVEQSSISNVGGADEPEDYINKNGKYQEKGETVVHIARRGEIKANQGKRTDIDDIDMYIQKGLTPNEIMDIKFSYRKYEKSITVAFFRKRYLETPTHRNLLVYWHTGESGSGKSYTYVILCEQYGEDEVYLVTDYQDPFGKYNGERIIVLDEFRGQIPYYKLLNEILSNYRVQVHSRYTNRYALWTEVHICTVFTPQMCYQNMVQTNQNVDGIDQLNRRITLMVYHHKDENGNYHRFDLPMYEYKGIEDLKARALKVATGQVAFDELIEQCKNDIPIFDE